MRHGINMVNAWQSHRVYHTTALLARLRRRTLLQSLFEPTTKTTVPFHHHPIVQTNCLHNVQDWTGQKWKWHSGISFDTLVQFRELAMCHPTKPSATSYETFT